MNVSTYNLVLVQEFNLIKVPRHREDLEKFSVQTSIYEEVYSIIRIYNCLFNLELLNSYGGIIVAWRRMIIWNVDGCGGKELVV